MKFMPIQVAPYRGGACVPFGVFDAHEAQCQKNHQQSVQRIAERGGFSWAEACAVIEDREWRAMDDREAQERVMAHVVEWARDSQREALTAELRDARAIALTWIPPGIARASIESAQAAVVVKMVDLLAKNGYCDAAVLVVRAWESVVSAPPAIIPAPDVDRGERAAATRQPTVAELESVLSPPAAEPGKTRAEAEAWLLAGEQPTGVLAWDRAVPAQPVADEPGGYALCLEHQTPRDDCPMCRPGPGKHNRIGSLCTLDNCPHPHDAADCTCGDVGRDRECPTHGDAAVDRRAELGAKCATCGGCPESYAQFRGLDSCPGCGKGT